MKKWAILLFVSLTLLSTSALAQNNWEVLNPENPPDPVCGHSLVRTTPEVIFAFGGKKQSTVVDDLYEFSDNTWPKVQVTGTSPAAREGQAAWSYNGKMYVFGGKGSDSLYHDLWRYEPATSVWKGVAAGFVRPSPRYGHAVDVAEDGKVYISGGTDAAGKALNDLWVMNTDYSFTELFGNLYHTSNHKIHVVGDSLYLFGTPGVVSKYQIPTDRWIQIPVGPQPVGYFSSAAIPVGHSSAALSPAVKVQSSQADTRIFLFGGLNEDGSESDRAYEFNPSESTLTEIPERMPMPLYRGAAAPYGPGILLFGGISNGELSNATILFTPQSANYCVATLSADLKLHVPIINFNNDQVYYWADFSYGPGELDFTLTDVGFVTDISPFGSCSPAVLSSDFKLHVPAVTFYNVSYWVDFQYAHDLIFALISAGQN